MNGQWTLDSSLFTLAIIPLTRLIILTFARRREVNPITLRGGGGGACPLFLYLWWQLWDEWPAHLCCLVWPSAPVALFILQRWRRHAHRSVPNRLIFVAVDMNDMQYYLQRMVCMRCLCRAGRLERPWPEQRFILWNSRINRPDQYSNLSSTFCHLSLFPSVPRQPAYHVRLTVCRYYKDIM